MKAKRPRFEVEDIQQRTNSTFCLVGGTVCMHNTSRGSGNRLIEVWGPIDFPVTDVKGVEVASYTAEAYYDTLYSKSMDGREGVWFLGYVDENFQPIEEE